MPSGVYIRTPEHKEQISIGLKEKWQNPEFRDKKSGKNHWNFEHRHLQKLSLRDCIILDFKDFVDSFIEVNVFFRMKRLVNSYVQSLNVVTYDKLDYQFITYSLPLIAGHYIKEKYVKTKFLKRSGKSYIRLK